MQDDPAVSLRLDALLARDIPPNQIRESSRSPEYFMSHTIKVIAGGLVLLGVFVLVGRLLSSGAPLAGMLTAARWFIPVWLIAAGINLWIGVAKAGYSVAEEAPIFLLVFAVPAAVAGLILWRLSRG